MRRKTKEYQIFVLKDIFSEYELKEYYFLKEDNNINEDIKDKDHLKKQKCLNLGNSERMKPKCETEETD